MYTTKPCFNLTNKCCRLPLLPRPPSLLCNCTHRVASDTAKSDPRASPRPPPRRKPYSIDVRLPTSNHLDQFVCGVPTSTKLLADISMAMASEWEEDPVPANLPQEQDLMELDSDAAYHLTRAIRDVLQPQKDFLQAQIEADELVIRILRRKAEQVALAVLEAQAQLEPATDTPDTWGSRFPDKIVDPRIAYVNAIKAERMEGGGMLWEACCGI